MSSYLFAFSSPIDCALSVQMISWKRPRSRQKNWLRIWAWQAMPSINETWELRFLKRYLPVEGCTILKGLGNAVQRFMTKRFNRLTAS